MKVNAKFVGSLAAFACPACALGLAFAARLIADEKLGFRVVGVGGICFTVVAGVGLVGAFTRRETLRWFTVLPLLVLLALFGLGLPA